MKFLIYFKEFTKCLIPPIIVNKLNYLRIKELIYKLFNNNFYEYETKAYNKISFINYTTRNYNFNNCYYLEIGILFGETFKSISLDEKNKFGVDPFIDRYIFLDEDRKLHSRIFMSAEVMEKAAEGGGSVNNISCGGVYHLTSDIFFKYKNKNLKFDIIFIDGHHTYEQLQKDVINALSSLNDNGIIFIHDLLPRNHLESSEIQKSLIWHGAIWKVAVELSEHPDLIFKIVNIDRGLGILRKKNYKKYIDKTEELRDKNFNDFLFYYKKKLPIVNCSEGFSFINQD
jgi:hypothetical protein